MNLSLNADAGLRTFLPPEEWKGDAQYRFVFREDKDDEIALLARVAIIWPSKDCDRFGYCVLLRPENAEESRIFIYDGFVENRGNIDLDYFTNQIESRVASNRYDWSYFERDCNTGGLCYLSRYWSKSEQGWTILLRIRATGSGDIVNYKSTNTTNLNFVRNLTPWGTYGEPFEWNRDRRYAPFVIKFLRQSDESFQNQFQEEWSNPGGEIQTIIKWRGLSEDEQDAWAFHCQNGDWKEFVGIAALALQVRIGNLKTKADEKVLWNLADLHGPRVCGIDLSTDQFLHRWRSVLIDMFQPDNVDISGKAIFNQPHCIRNRMNYKGIVRTHFPSQHELMEATLQLKEWVYQHFPLNEAQRLLTL